ncbi:hypothetical protein HNR60_000594 [Rhodopseudomonas rhenobacensis]|uniref:Uncharacterized protein n=1 Tax=Rhodopseudomonas rhenobacensis TaxID=87461 RepID=A0A7W8DX63_9BRAD|nr:hypothetical protein [Rhodopseudomonas rhenobacensis]MBB5045859.1 hypothetical protein [Rhodopseudomonas rhenobacensis]
MEATGAGALVAAALARDGFTVFAGAGRDGSAAGFRVVTRAGATALDFAVAALADFAAGFFAGLVAAADFALGFFAATNVEDFLRVCLDMRLPFVAFGRSINVGLRMSWQGCRCWASPPTSGYGYKGFETPAIPVR